MGADVADPPLPVTFGDLTGAAVDVVVVEGLGCEPPPLAGAAGGIGGKLLLPGGANGGVGAAGLVPDGTTGAAGLPDPAGGAAGLPDPV